MEIKILVPVLLMVMMTGPVFASEITGTLSTGGASTGDGSALSGTVTPPADSLGGTVTPSDGSLSGTVSPPSSASGGSLDGSVSPSSGGLTGTVVAPTPPAPAAPTGGGGGGNGPPVGLISSPISGGAVLGASTSTMAQGTTTPTTGTSGVGGAVPGVPNTGAGAQAPLTVLALALSGLAMAASALYLRRQWIQRV